MTAHRSPNFEPRLEGQPIDMLVIHYTGMPTAEAALERLCDPAAKVGAHYVIDEDGTVHPMIDEAMRAWHAGVAFWRGETDVNGRSIGIELVNPGHEFVYRPFPEAQMAALIALARDIVARHPIPPTNVLGHSDVAPRRKTDPGELFDWPRLAAAGIGRWPTGAAAGRGNDDVAGLLAAVGYETVDLEKTVEAFQRHFRPARIDGTMDDETLGLLRMLAGDTDGKG
ncbi:MAG: N-acetylmuramoyl-L-alanine amidase [Rhodospirillales bacterium]|nr:N-acetylmuramoyl-L-alanine amidase [Rhodospirillales bacterium]